MNIGCHFDFDFDFGRKILNIGWVLIVMLDINVKDWANDRE